MRVYYVHKCTYNEKGTMKGVEMCAKRWRGKKLRVWRGVGL